MSTKNDSKSSTKPSTHSTRKINPKNILSVFGKDVCSIRASWSWPISQDSVLLKQISFCYLPRKMVSLVYVKQC